MIYFVRLFVVGLLISFLLPILEEEIIVGFSEDFSVVLNNMFSYVPHFWKLGYSVLLTFILPSLNSKIAKTVNLKTSQTF